jgi:hypothetical protein
LPQAFNYHVISSALEEIIVISEGFVGNLKAKSGLPSSAFDKWRMLIAFGEARTICNSCETLSKSTEFKIYQKRITRSDGSESSRFFK